jgi:hypothetical protein
LIPDEKAGIEKVRVIEGIGFHHFSSAIKDKGQVSLPFASNECHQKWVILSEI